MMTIRCRSRFSALLLCLPLGLCFASTAWGASDDDEDWHDTKGPRSERGSSDDSNSEKKSETSDKSDKSDKADEDSDKDSNKDSDKDADKADKKGSGDDWEDKDSEHKGKGKRKRKAHSDSSYSDSKLSLALLGSYGTADPQSFGMGLRGGYNLVSPLPLYFGVVGEYFFGSQSSQKDFGKRTTRTLSFFYFAAEGGANVELTTEMSIRPYLGLGIGANKDETCSDAAGCRGGRSAHLVMTPGVVGLYQIGSFFLGPDIRYIIVPGGNDASGVTFSLTAGFSF